MNTNSLVLFIVTAVALLLATIIGVSIGQSQIFNLAIGASALIGLIWVVGGGNIWWTIVLFGFFLGGTLQFGFKIYTYELSILAGIAALIPNLALRFNSVNQKRGYLPIIFLLLLGYVCLHCIGSIMYNKLHDIGAIGNVVRGYSAALWGLGMVFLVFHFGLSRVLPIAFYFGYIAIFIRLIEGWIVYFLGHPIVVPGINFVGAASGALLSSTDDEFGFSQDLRHSGLYLAAFALASVGLAKSTFARWLNILIFLIAAGSIPFGGGRAAIFYLTLLPMLYFFIYRRYITIIAFFSLFILGVGVINISPSLLHEAPMPVERALSRFIFENQDQHGAAASDHFHDRLTEEAYASWTYNLSTFFFGTGIRGVEKGFDLSASYGFGNFGIWVETMVENAKRAGVYESGFWTIVAVTGLVGLILYGGTLLLLSIDAALDLRRHGISDFGRALGFIGLYYAILWIAVSWKIGGGFPCLEIFLLFLGWIWRHDEKHRNDLQKHSNTHLLSPSKLTPDKLKPAI